MRDDKAAEEKLAEILHPSTRAKEFKITLEFGYRLSPDYPEAVDLAKKNPAYAEEGRRRMGPPLGHLHPRPGR
jgi:hypothetical protein